MRSPVVFTVIMMSGMLLASALLSFQLDKTYAQSTDPDAHPEHVTFDITIDNNNCVIQGDGSRFTELTCTPSGATTTTLNNPFDSFFELDCDLSNPSPDSITAICELDFLEAELAGNDFDMNNVFCSNVDLIQREITDCSGTLDDENHN